MKLFQQLLTAQLTAHPAMEARDVVKLCYQAANGAEHLLEDMSGARRYFYEEYESVPVTDEPLFERISRDIYRANLGAWKKAELPPERLWELFAGAVFQNSGAERLTEHLQAAEDVLRETGFPMAQWTAYTDDYKKQGMPPVRHSAAYRQAERPAYRIVQMDEALRKQFEA